MYTAHRFGVIGRSHENALELFCTLSRAWTEVVYVVCGIIVLTCMTAGMQAAKDKSDDELLCLETDAVLFTDDGFR